MNILAKLTRAIRFYRNVYFPENIPILVYQMGKVGSSSVIRSLEKLNYNPCFHVHRLNPANIEAVKKEYMNKAQGYAHAQADRHSMVIYKYLVIKNTRLKVITMVREPVGRNISAYFQNFSHFTGEKFNPSKAYRNHELINTFFSKYSHDVPLEWFDKELNVVFNKDIYKAPFSPEKGFSIIYHNNVEILIMKCELSDEKKTAVLRSFIQNERFLISRSNVSKEKEYANLYKEFIKNIKIPATYIDRLYDSKYTRHFYSDKEIDLFRNKWLGESKDMESQ